MKKKCFAIRKNIIYFLLLFTYSFGFSFKKWFIKLEKVLLQHFKSFKMEKIWKKYTKMFSGRQVFGDGSVTLDEEKWNRKRSKEEKNTIFFFLEIFWGM